MSNNKDFPNETFLEGVKRRAEENIFIFFRVLVNSKLNFSFYFFSMMLLEFTQAVCLLIPRSNYVNENLEERNLSNISGLLIDLRAFITLLCGSNFVLSTVFLYFTLATLIFMVMMLFVVVWRAREKKEDGFLMSCLKYLCVFVMIATRSGFLFPVLINNLAFLNCEEGKMKLFEDQSCSSAFAKVNFGVAIFNIFFFVCLYGLNMAFFRDRRPPSNFPYSNNYMVISIISFGFKLFLAFSYTFNFASNTYQIIRVSINTSLAFAIIFLRNKKIDQKATVCSASKIFVESFYFCYSLVGLLSVFLDTNFKARHLYLSFTFSAFIGACFVMAAVSKRRKFYFIDVSS